MNNTNKKISKRRQSVKHDLYKNSVIENARMVLDHTSQGQQDYKVCCYRRESSEFMKTFKKDYRRFALIYNSCIKAEQERERQNNEEIDQLKIIYNQMQAEITNIKRKRWCRFCESEATYQSSNNNSYCSPECEQRHNELVSAVDDIFVI